MSLERSPFFEDLLLTVGDWSFAIWRQGETTPLFQSNYGRDYYACGTSEACHHLPVLFRHCPL